MAQGDPGSDGQLIVARVGEALVGLLAAGVARVLPMLPLWRPPTAPAPLAGFVSVDGGVLPVLDAGAVLGLGAARPALYAHILMLRDAADRPVGLLVDRAEGVATPAQEGAIDPARSLNGCAVALFQYRGALAHRIAPERLLGLAERTALAALSAEAERRRAEWQTAA